MCGIAGFVSLGRDPTYGAGTLALMSELIRHRGPDGEGTWIASSGRVGFAHRRLSVIDLSDAAGQPMVDERGNCLSYNGEIYNYREIRSGLADQHFRTGSDTEVVLRSLARQGTAALAGLRGMFAFAYHDAARDEVVLARDRFGIKPLYWAVVDGHLLFASEAKALLPFMPEVETDTQGLRDYLAFQFCLEGKTLFKGIRELPPGHFMRIDARGGIETVRYWEVYYHPDFQHTPLHFRERLAALLDDSVALHLRSDVPIGAYVSGGFDSSLIATLAARASPEPLKGFHGRFPMGSDFDESAYARAAAAGAGLDLHVIDIGPADFVATVADVIWHLDFPTAGPGSFSQYMVSREAARTRKVVLGGQGGDEVFGGYTRYLIAYFEQCIKAAINGTANNGQFVVTYESIIPNLTALRGYQPLLQEFWREGLFDPMDRRYYRLVNRSAQLGAEIRWQLLPDYDPFETFQRVFDTPNVGKQSYFDLMTHFDFKTLLPALLQVEDRVSMAHGLESRVPLLDHPLVEFAATMPADIKFANGAMKHILKETFGHLLPDAVRLRTDKMGFPTPINEWASGPAREYVMDVLGSQAAATRPFVDNRAVRDGIGKDRKFGRNLWGMLSLELWHQAFHDRSAALRARAREARNQDRLTRQGAHA